MELDPQLAQKVLDADLANMAKRVHATCTYVVEELDNDIPSVWAGIDTAAAVIKNMKK